MYKMLPKQAISHEDFIKYIFQVYSQRISIYIFVLKPFLRNKEHLFLAPHLHHLLPFNFSAFHTFSNLCWAQISGWVVCFGHSIISHTFFQMDWLKDLIVPKEIKLLWVSWGEEL